MLGAAFRVSGGANESTDFRGNNHIEAEVTGSVRGGNCFCGGYQQCKPLVRGAMEWFYSQHGKQNGPVETEELLRKLSSGEVAGSDLAWRVGMGGWRAISMIPELNVAPSMPIPPALPVVGGGGDMESPYTPPISRTVMPIGQEIPNYMWQAIVVTLFCCLPFGIPAIIYASKVDSKKTVGDLEGALAASKSAKLWCIVSAGSVGVLVLLWVILVLFIAVFSDSGLSNA